MINHAGSVFSNDALLFHLMVPLVKDTDDFAANFCQSLDVLGAVVDKFLRIVFPGSSVNSPQLQRFHRRATPTGEPKSG